MTLIEQEQCVGGEAETASRGELERNLKPSDRKKGHACSKIAVCFHPMGCYSSGLPRTQEALLPLRAQPTICPFPRAIRPTNCSSGRVPPASPRSMRL